MTAARHIAAQTAISIVINMALSAAFFLLLFGGQEFVSVWGARGYAADFVPQSFMITLMSVLMPGLATERKLRAGQVVPYADGTRLPRNPGLRALVLAVPAALAGGAAMAALLELAAVDGIAWEPALGFKVAYGGLLGSIVTPIGLRAALARRDTPRHSRKPGDRRREQSMSRRFVDLSITLENDVITDPPFMRPKITYQQHADTVAELGHFFPGVTKEDLPDQAGFAAAEWVTLTTHNGTHLDAPWHFHPTMDGGKRAITIDEVPLDWCFRPGVKLDFRHFPDGYVVTAADVEAELARIGHALQPLDIVLVNTAAGGAVGNPDFVNIGCGMGYEATLYLTQRGVRVTGTDAWSWDAPFSYTAERVKETGDTSLIWEGHKAGRDIGYCHLEKLHNLEALPANGFTVSCFPHKIRGASAGWTRAVAIFED